MSLTVMCVVTYVYMPKENVQEAEIQFSGSSQEFVTSFKSAPNTYLGKVVEISGQVKSASDHSILLRGGVFCQFNTDTILSLDVLKHVVLRGKVLGYDELVDEVKLSQCIIKERK